MSRKDKEFEHAPLSKLDYGFDWKIKGWLNTGETISTSNWEVDVGLTSSGAQIVDGVTSIIVEGGVAGSSYKLKNSIITSLGRKDSRTIVLYCKAR